MLVLNSFPEAAELQVTILIALPVLRTVWCEALGKGILDSSGMKAQSFKVSAFELLTNENVFDGKFFWNAFFNEFDYFALSSAKLKQRHVFRLKTFVLFRQMLQYILEFLSF